MKTLLNRIALLAMLLLIVSEVEAQPGPRRRSVPPPEPPTPGIWQKSMVGGRLGPWISDGFGTDVDDGEFRLKANSTAFHLEFFFMPHLTGPLNLEATMGAISRGDIRISTNSGFSGLGTATIYPLSLGLAWFPFAKSINATLQPSLHAGGSLIVGTESYDIFDDIFGQYLGVGTESRVKLGYYGGANILWVLGSQFGLTSGVKYQHAKFGKELFGVRDYSGIQILFGASYFYQ